MMLRSPSMDTVPAPCKLSKVEKGIACSFKAKECRAAHGFCSCWGLGYGHPAGEGWPLELRK